MNTSQHHIPDPDAHKSPEKLEEEVNQARARIGEKLETLSNRLSPGELVDQVLGMAREHGGEFTRNLGAQMKNNPVPLIITGIGMSWLMMASNTRSYSRSRGVPYGAGYDHSDGYAPRYTDGVADYPYNARSSYSNPDDYDRPMGTGTDSSGPNVMDKAKDAMGRVGDRVEDLKDAAREKVDRMSDTLHQKMDRASDAVHQNLDGMHRRMHSNRQHEHFPHQPMRSAQECVTDLFREQPVLAASLGVALGAAIGALLPATEVEEKLMGSVSEQAVSKAQDLASEQYEKVRDTAKEMAENVKENIDEAISDKRNSDGASSQPV